MLAGPGFAQAQPRCQRGPRHCAQSGPLSSLARPVRAHTGRRHSRRQSSLRASTREEIQRNLLSALTTQFQRDTLPWLEDLLIPLVSGPPGPLTDTRSPREIADIDSRFAEVNDIDLHYKEYVGAQSSSHASSTSSTQLTTSTRQQSPTDNPPDVLMLHGFNGSEYNWRLVTQPIADQLRALQRGGAETRATASDSWEDPVPAGGYGPLPRVVAYDRPPFGLSGRPLGWTQGEGTDPYTLAGGAEIARGLINKLQLKSVVAVGHSAGAPIVLELAARYPELISGVVLVAPAVTTDSRGFLARADIGQLLRFGLTRLILDSDTAGLTYVRRSIRKRANEVRQGKLGVHHDNDKFASQEEIIENYLKPMRAHDWDRASLEMFRRSSFNGPNIDFAAIKAPVLIIEGREDQATPPSMARALEQKLRESGVPHAEYHELSDCGHLPMEEKPEEFVQITNTWLTKLSAGRLHTNKTPYTATAVREAEKPTASAAQAAGKPAAKRVAVASHAQ